MSEEPNNQVKAFVEAAKAMKRERYARQDTVEGQRDFLYALQDVARELAYHLDAQGILSTPAMEAYKAATPTNMPPFPASSELILTVELEERIQALWAVDRAEPETI